MDKENYHQNEIFGGVSMLKVVDFWKNIGDKTCVHYNHQG